MYRISLTLSFFLLWMACQPSQTKSTFKDFVDAYHASYNQLYPSSATLNGDHSYDYLLEIPDEAPRQAERQFCQRFLKEGRQLKSEALSPAQATKKQLMLQQIEQILSELDSIQSYASDASLYHILPAFQTILAAEDVKPKDRLRVLQRRLQFVPDYFQAAKQNLRPSANGYEKAIQQSKASFQWLGQELTAATQQANLPISEKQQLFFLIEEARLSIKDFVGFCNSRNIDQYQVKKESVRSTH